MSARFNFLLLPQIPPGDQLMVSKFTYKTWYLAVLCSTVLAEKLKVCGKWHEPIPQLMNE